jgi:hypothetical protein
MIKTTPCKPLIAVMIMVKLQENFFENAKQLLKEQYAGPFRMTVALVLSHLTLSF